MRCPGAGNLRHGSNGRRNGLSRKPCRGGIDIMHSENAGIRSSNGRTVSIVFVVVILGFFFAGSRIAKEK